MKQKTVFLILCKTAKNWLQFMVSDNNIKKTQMELSEFSCFCENMFKSREFFLLPAIEILRLQLLQGKRVCSYSNGFAGSQLGNRNSTFCF